ncbi:hypothetical protein L210DRAFT_2834815 [Boletus edulis BED1]|uniref:Uncharacterized protein n=1 Tax=Boletus edulis BED1 TaxID=1328754 RepID=A0AAD4C403_BOLED|nr:hypothetical protein L210DRAFT_2834815 [Boletus edulis BED1]
MTTVRIRVRMRTVAVTSLLVRCTRPSTPSHSADTPREASIEGKDGVRGRTSDGAIDDGRPIGSEIAVEKMAGILGNEAERMAQREAHAMTRNKSEHCTTARWRQKSGPAIHEQVMVLAPEASKPLPNDPRPSGDCLGLTRDQHDAAHGIVVLGVRICKVQSPLTISGNSSSVARLLSTFDIPQYSCNNIFWVILHTSIFSASSQFQPELPVFREMLEYYLRFSLHKHTMVSGVLST